MAAFGPTPNQALIQAVYYQDYPGALAAIAQGADVPRADVEAAEYYCISFIEHLCSRAIVGGSRIDFVRTLVENGANPRARNDSALQNIYFYFPEDLETATYLITNCGADIHTVNPENYTTALELLERRAIVSIRKRKTWEPEETPDADAMEVDDASSFPAPAFKRICVR